MHELSMHNSGAHHGHHNHSKSLMKGSDELGLIDKKKEILDKKRYEQMHKNYNQMGTKAGQGMPSVSHNVTNDDQGQAGDYVDSTNKLDSSV